jgi:hypothetical protein
MSVFRKWRRRATQIPLLPLRRLRAAVHQARQWRGWDAPQFKWLRRALRALVFSLLYLYADIAGLEKAQLILRLLEPWW